MYCCGNRGDVAAEAHDELRYQKHQHNQHNQHNVQHKRKLQEKQEVADREAAARLAATTYQVGVALAEEGKLKEALSCFREAIEYNAVNVDAHYMAGVLCQELNLPIDALDFYRKTIRLQPTHFLAIYNLGYCYLDLHTADGRARAVKCFRRATELEPSDADAHINLGLALKTNGRAAEACKSFQRAIEIDSGSVMALFNLGNTFSDMRSLDKAITAFSKALEIDPTHKDTQFNLAIAYQDRSCLNPGCIGRDGDIRRAIMLYDRVGSPEAILASQQLRLLLRAESAEAQLAASFSNTSMNLSKSYVQTNSARKPLQSLTPNVSRSYQGGQQQGKQHNASTPSSAHVGGFDENSMVI